jgi:hypothetical protein
MVKGVMVLMKGVQIGTLYKFLGAESIQTNFDLTRAKSIQTNLTIHHKFDLTVLWPEMMGHIGGKGLRAMYNKGIVEYFLECNLEVEFVNIVYMENKVK